MLLVILGKRCPYIVYKGLESKCGDHCRVYVVAKVLWDPFGLSAFLNCFYFSHFSSIMCCILTDSCWYFLLGDAEVGWKEKSACYKLSPQNWWCSCCKVIYLLSRVLLCLMGVTVFLNISRFSNFFLGIMSCNIIDSYWFFVLHISLTKGSQKAYEGHSVALNLFLFPIVYALSFLNWLIQIVAYCCAS